LSIGVKNIVSRCEKHEQNQFMISKFNTCTVLMPVDVSVGSIRSFAYVHIGVL